jgi:hypothetical protein
LAAGPSATPVGSGRGVWEPWNSRGFFGAGRMRVEGPIHRAFQWGYMFRPRPWCRYVGSQLPRHNCLYHKTRAIRLLTAGWRKLNGSEALLGIYRQELPGGRENRSRAQRGWLAFLGHLGENSLTTQGQSCEHRPNKDRWTATEPIDLGRPGTSCLRSMTGWTGGVDRAPIRPAPQVVAHAVPFTR